VPKLDNPLFQHHPASSCWPAPGEPPKGDGATARDALAKALDYLPLALEQGCRLYRNFLPEDPAHHRRLASLQNVRRYTVGKHLFSDSVMVATETPPARG
jgi:hypothetical protein